uniref:Uncharacterized protein n=1 Tax=Helianthus annuus TaxID=4232 RepID=A0A251SYZ6_HELAN
MFCVWVCLLFVGCVICTSTLHLLYAFLLRQSDNCVGLLCFDVVTFELRLLSR